MDSFETEVARTLDKLTKWLMVVSVFLVLLVGAVTYAIVIGRDSIDASHAQSHSAKTTAVSASLQAKEAKQLANAIQSERRATVLQNCKDQDARNRATIATLNKEEVRSAKASRRLLRAFRFRVSASVLQQEQRASYAETVALINALAPVANCQALVQKEAAG